MNSSIPGVVPIVYGPVFSGELDEAARCRREPGSTGRSRVGLLAFRPEYAYDQFIVWSIAARADLQGGLVKNRASWR